MAGDPHFLYRGVLPARPAAQSAANRTFERTSGRASLSLQAAHLDGMNDRSTLPPARGRVRADQSLLGSGAHARWPTSISA
jgi:hypothetical protein